MFLTEGPPRREHGMVQSGSVCVCVRMYVGSYVETVSSFVYLHSLLWRGRIKMLTCFIWLIKSMIIQQLWWDINAHIKIPQMLTIKEVYQFILLKFFLINIYLYITYILPTDGKIANLTFFRLTHIILTSLIITKYLHMHYLLWSWALFLSWWQCGKKLFFHQFCQLIIGQSIQWLC